MIYYVTPTLARPSGGVRTMYRHVDVLNKCGIPAAVVHAQNNFRCTWFENHTRVEYPPIVVGGDDVLVFPEQFSAEAVNRVAPGVRKVVLNQNAYRTFAGTSPSGHSPSLESPDVVAAIVVSRDNQEYLQFAFPELPVYRVRHWLDGSVFFPDFERQGRRIATMPHKRPDDFRQILAMLERRGTIQGWDVITLRGRSEADVAQELRRAPLFLSMARAEGFGLPGAEALASGCFVIGSHGQAGKEFLIDPFATPVDGGDVVALASAVESFVRHFDDRKKDLRHLMARASQWILGEYSYEHQAADLSEVFGVVATLAAPQNAGATPAGRIVARDLRVESRMRATARGLAVRAGRAMGV